MEQQHIDDVWIGANSTVYFLAIALGSPFVEKLLRKIGIRRTMMFGLLVTGSSAPLFPMTTELPLWFLIRVVMGFGVCCYLVGGQTALNNFSHESNRTSVNGLHALGFVIGFGIGPIVGPHIYTISPQLAFVFGGGVILSGLVVVWRGLPDSFVVFPPSSTNVFKKITLPLYGVFSCGFAEATLVSLYPVFLLRQNYSVEKMGYAFSVFVVGGILSTLPVTRLADIFGKLRLFFIILWVELLSTLGLLMVEKYQLTLLFSFFVGVGLGPILPLCLALIGEKLSKNELPSGSALFTTTYSFGSAAGPILSSIMMGYFGSRNIFSLCIPLYAILLLRIKLQYRDFRRLK
jgi:MFS family permease